MPRKEQRCPKCYTVLESGSGLRMKCPNVKCDFIDRRSGNSVIADSHERRGRDGVPMNDPWLYADRKSIR